VKKLLTVLAVFALALAGCGDGTSEDPGKKNDDNGKTTLTITNSSNYGGLVFSFGTTDFGSINRGSSSTKDISAGTRYISVIAEYDFQNPVVIEKGFGSVQQMFEVNEVFTCEDGKSNQFNFTNNTVVTMIGGDSGYRDAGGLTTGTLAAIFTGIENYYLHLDD